MTYGALPLAAALQTFLVGALLVVAVAVAALVVYYVRRARSQELAAPAEDATRAVSEMRAIGDRIETLVSQQQLQGETQRQRIGQQIDEVRQVVSQQGHRVDGLRGELRQEVQRRDQEIEAIRQQLSAIQRAALPAADETPALPAPQTLALPAAEATAQPEPAFEPAAPPEPTPVPGPAARPEPVVLTTAGGDSFGGDSFGRVDALPARPAPAPVEAPPPAAQPEPVAETPPTPEPAPDGFFQPSPPAAWAPPPAPAVPPETSVFSDVGFDVFAPGEPAPAPQPEPAADAFASPDPFADAAEPAWDLGLSAPPPASEPPATEPPAARPPQDHAWVTTPAAPPVPVFEADEWDLPATAAPAPPEPEPVVEAFVPPADADDFSFISTVTEDVQRALYMAGVTKLEEIAHWSRSDARRISAEVGVSEDTIMNQWVFEAQGALFERYSSHVGG